MTIHEIQQFCESAAERSLSRRNLLACAGAATVLGMASLVGAQPKPAANKRVVEDRTLTAEDGSPVAITYFQSTRGKDAPAVILLHQERSSRIVWRSYAERLQDEGYAVVTMDLRKHGQAVAGATGTGKAPAPQLKPADYQGMVLDVEAIKSFLLEEHEKGQLNVRKTAIVAASMSVPVAIVYAANDWLKRPYDDAPTFAARTPRGQDIRALILLSPEENLTGLTTPKAIGVLRDPNVRVATMIAVGSRDRLDKSQARELHKKFAGTEKDTEINLFQKYEANFRGTDLLGRRLKTEEHILAFLKKYLMDLPDEWRTRKSRLAT